jgi:GMP synthase (glutamine-hydrolysing)
MLLIIDMTNGKQVKYLKMLEFYIKKSKIDYSLISNIDNICLIDYTKVKGVIISGSSLSLVTLDKHSINFLRKAIYPLILTNVPVLGICFGYQLLNYIFGGSINKMKQTEKCFKNIKINKNPLFINENNYKNLTVWLYHTDYINKLSHLFKIIAYDDNNNIMAFYNKKKKYFGVQFHPEASIDTHFILKNFLNICKIF